MGQKQRKYKPCHYFLCWNQDNKRSHKFLEKASQHTDNDIIFIPQLVLFPHTAQLSSFFTPIYIFDLRSI